MTLSIPQGGFEQLIPQIQYNCDLSDARYAGLYSVCGLALRLRDLYKWEKGLAPWVEKEPSEILDWIGSKEEAWEEIRDESYKKLELDRHQFDPFDTQTLNQLLYEHGLFYGAGYGRGLKPTFFMAQIMADDQVDGTPVYILGKELARDLFAVPALTQDSTILIRQKIAEVYLWDQMVYINKSGRRALDYALNQMGLGKQDRSAWKSNLTELTREVMGIYLHHEMGELSDEGIDRELWQEMIGAYPRSSIELFARAIKDILADTGSRGALHYILTERRPASLGFYVAFMEGMHKSLFPELRDAFADFVKNEDWNLIEHAVKSGFEKARGLADRMMVLFQQGKQMRDLKWAEEALVDQLIKPLTS